MTEFYKIHKQSIDRAAFLLIVTVVVYVLFTVLFTFLAPFFFALLLALVLEPVVRFLCKRLKCKRWVASLICLLLFLAILSSLGAWLVATLVRQVSDFAVSAPFHAAEIGERLNEFNLRLQRMGDSLPDGWEIPEIQDILLTAVTVLFGEGMRDQGARLATVIPNFFLNTIIMLVSAHLLISDRENIFNSVKSAFPKWLSQQMRHMRKGLSRAMGGYFRAQYILMLVVGMISIVGLLILRSPYALLLGLLFAVLDFLPIVGTGAVVVPWAIVSLIMGNYHQAIGLGIMYGVITITRQVLQPKILGDQMGAHPLASLMSIFIGFRIFGLLGLIIGPSLLMIFVAIYEARETPNFSASE